MLAETAYRRCELRDELANNRPNATPSPANVSGDVLFASSL